mmetsp:Transcript_33880/g.66656  ORF Transcript_33880/g.66656 Transcript_33880/m.66656 type:complete len:96 (-) Transcript_33880:76-363(-)
MAGCKNEPQVVHECGFWGSDCLRGCSDMNQQAPPSISGSSGHHSLSHLWHLLHLHCVPDSPLDSASGLASDLPSDFSSKLISKDSSSDCPLDSSS